MAVQIILELIIVLVGCCGMVLHSEIMTEKPRRDFFRYYTNLSNLLVVMFYLIRTVVRILGTYDGFFGRIVFSELWFYSVTMSIFLTFGIFHFVLMPVFRKAEPGSDGFRLVHSPSNYIVHYIIPLLSLLNWLIFADKTQFRYAWAVIWAVVPWAYVIYAEIRGAHGDRIENSDSAYPYDFMDAGKHGWPVVIRNCLLVTVIFIAAGFILLFVRNLI